MLVQRRVRHEGERRVAEGPVPGRRVRRSFGEYVRLAFFPAPAEGAPRLIRAHRPGSRLRWRPPRPRCSLRPCASPRRRAHSRGSSITGFPSASTFSIRMGCSSKCSVEVVPPEGGAAIAELTLQPQGQADVVPFEPLYDWSAGATSGSFSSSAALTVGHSSSDTLNTMTSPNVHSSFIGIWTRRNEAHPDEHRASRHGLARPKACSSRALGTRSPGCSGVISKACVA